MLWERPYKPDVAGELVLSMQEESLSRPYFSHREKFGPFPSTSTGQAQFEIQKQVFIS